jgi:hypothetical protein
MRSLAILVGLSLAAVVAARPLVALAATDSVETLAEQLKTGLRVQAPRDVAFCDEVARLVRVGRLPAELVDATYVWAIRRGRKYPFPAFELALRLKADRLGIRLP